MDRPNIAMVVLDTLRADAFSRSFEWIPGLRFENAYSTSHWTVPAHASLLTGKYPSEIGVHAKSMGFTCPEPTIVEALNDEGYSTRMWSANLQIQMWDGWDRGFDQVLGDLDIHPAADESVDWGQFIDETATDGILKYPAALKHVLSGSGKVVPSLRFGLKLARRDAINFGGPSVLERLRRTTPSEPEFLLINLMEAHTPHRPPKPFRTFEESVDFKIGDAFAGVIDNPDRNRRAYDDSCAHLSAIYRKIFSTLQDRYDYVVTLSDHGELLGEHGLWNHGYGLYPELARVPLVLTGNGIESGVREDVISLLDVPQTIAGITDVDFESRGRDLLSEADPVDRLVEYHGLLPWHRDQFERKGVGQVYDEYDTSLDGIVTAENEYVYRTHDDGVVAREGTLDDEHRSRLNDLRSNVPVRSVSSEAEEVSNEVKSRLEDLGYA